MFPVAAADARAERAGARPSRAVWLHAVEQPTFRPRYLIPLRLEAGDSSLRTESSLPGAMDSPSSIFSPFTVTGMETVSRVGARRILCVESGLAILESPCAVLKASGYDAASATPRVAEIVLRSQKFDLIVVSSVSDSDLHRVINLSDGADVLVLEETSMPAELTSLVAQRFGRQRRA
jgi:hypothetical protein